MWSGPRNLSTAIMYAFGQRSDCAVVDEPLYAAYLAATGLDHPMRAQVLASQPTDAGVATEALVGPVPQGKTLFYQKHMTHHLLPGFPRGWLSGVTNVFLIRHPARVVASYARKREAPVLEDLGFLQQLEIFEETGGGPVIDSDDIRRDPAGALGMLCAELGIPWDAAMLHWPAGGRAEDGAWAPHWYGAVHRSTGFDGAEGPLPDLSPGYDALAAAALPAYRALSARRLRIRSEPSPRR
jgi:hypothetical protein